MFWTLNGGTKDQVYSSAWSPRLLSCKQLSAIWLSQRTHSGRANSLLNLRRICVFLLNHGVAPVSNPVITFQAKIYLLLSCRVKPERWTLSDKLESTSRALKYYLQFCGRRRHLRFHCCSTLACQCCFLSQRDLKTDSFSVCDVHTQKLEGFLGYPLWTLLWQRAVLLNCHTLGSTFLTLPLFCYSNLQDVSLDVRALVDLQNLAFLPEPHSSFPSSWSNWNHSVLFVLQASTAAGNWWVYCIT